METMRKWGRPALVALAATLFIVAALALQGASGAAGWLWSLSDGGTWLLPLIATTAVVDSVNPCSFSILLLTLAFLFGLGRGRGNLLAIGGLYIAGLFTVYLLIGLGLLQALHLFSVPHFMGTLGAVLMVALGAASLLGAVAPSFPLRPRIPAVAHHRMAGLIERASLSVAFPLGALVGLCEFPCTGGPYLTAVGLLHDQGSRLAGAGYLVLYNVIFVLPLVLILLAASDRAVLERMEHWHRTQKQRMRVWGGAAMVLLGLLIYGL